MTLSRQICPICGAKLPNQPTYDNFCCPHCAFKCDSVSGKNPQNMPAAKQMFADIQRIQRLKPTPIIYMDNIQASLFPTMEGTIFHPLTHEEKKIDCIYSPQNLPFESDLTDFFSQRFHQLKSGGLLFLSTPVERPFRSPAPLPGQINFFKAKNIMFLLEQRGFKMVWRRNRFSTELTIIARKD